jgi:SAM-dependent methyltransferase
MVTDVEEQLSVGERLFRLLDGLGLEQAHVAMRGPADLLSLAASAPGRIASITLQGTVGDPRTFTPFADRTMWLLGDGGASGREYSQSLLQLAGADVRWLQGCTEVGWTDTVAERAGEVAEAMLDFLSRRDAATPLPAVALSGSGTIAGVSYRAAGNGTPVLLLPLFLAPRQWDAILPALQAHHCTIVLGGKYLSPLSVLEERAASHYSQMALGCLDMAEPRTGESLIEVGCGTGALLRRIAQRGGLGRVAGLDINGFFLREARALAEAEGLGERLELHEGSAEAIPFPDDTFDIAFSSTVLEEVDAEQALAEVVRITNPGGRVVIVVRAIDMPLWTNVPLPPGLADKAVAPGLGVASEHACADRSLLRRMHAAGLRDVRGGPIWCWLRSTEPIWEFLARSIRSRLNADETAIWNGAIAAGTAEGVPLVLGWPHHCAVGVKAP